jgi:hypothetical protein
VSQSNVYVLKCRDTWYSDEEMSIKNGFTKKWEPSCEDSRSKPAVATDPTDEAFPRVSSPRHVPIVTVNLLSANPNTPQPNIWSEEEVKPTLDAVKNIDRMWVSSVPNDVTTGLIRQHGTRFNSSLNCKQVSRVPFPDSCLRHNSFTYDRPELKLRVCIPGLTDDALSYSNGIPIWYANRSSQHLHEELFIETSLPDKLTKYLHKRVEIGYSTNTTLICSGNTTKGYFELPNFWNNYTASGFKGKWPPIEEMDELYHDYDWSNSLITGT